MNGTKEWYVRMSDGNVYGPADVASLVSWAEDGRIDPSSSLSKDRIRWTPAQLMGELEMKWLVELEPGKPLGPYNRKYLVASMADGSLPPETKAYRLHEFPIDEDPPPTIVEKEVIKEVPVEKIVEKIVERRVEVPIEKIVEKIVEVPVEKIVEKIVEVEKRVEVPVEKIVEKIVEVEKPPRTTVVVPEVVEPAGNEPPRRAGGKGMFGDVSRSGLEALEQAARRELAAAGKSRFGFFGRKK
jgi:hypothetical protein